ncbi:class A beta-lactamase [Nitratireductor thuwali]|uniref:Beta-lactamase n=1 Tax=Nitratireductor thuwali TaxID=2267699 RepID=A0ABY5ME67_9HYPH|nr:Beta-lactamase [Nitratireductor thuwali]
MHLIVSRRGFALSAGAFMAAGAFSIIHPARAQSGADDALSRKFVEIEARLGARLGAAVLDTETGTRWSHRADERFPLNSTFKAFACAAVLARVDRGEEELNRRMVFHKSDLVTYSPVTELRAAGEGMTVGELCQAATAMSDNTAANLVLDSIGGPQGFTRFMRSIGDEATRLDRWEPALNEAIPGDPRDTTSPNAIMESLRKLVLGTALSPGSRGQLESWLAGNQVGGPLLRAGLPESWGIADRTGAGGHGSRGIVAVIRPPGRQPVVAAIYITRTRAPMDARNAAIAEIGSTLATLIAN